MSLETLNQPFYGNSVCAKCNSSLYGGCRWIKGEGETPSEMAVCDTCFRKAQPHRDLIEQMLNIYGGSKFHEMAAAAELCVAERDREWEPLRLAAQALINYREIAPSLFPKRMWPYIDALEHSLTPPTEQPERVRVELCLRNPERWGVFLDGANVLLQLLLKEQDAERYAAGLRAELKEKK